MLGCSFANMPAGEQSQAFAVERSSASLAQPLPLSKSGVYFNNCEVFHDMHPSQVKYSVKHATVFPSLPGQPMSQPPRLVTREPRNGVVTAEIPPQAADNLECEKVHSLGRNQSQYLKRRNNSSVAPEERATKRCRLEKKSQTLSGEERVFIEAALALSASADSASARKAPHKITPTVAAKSEVQALPPPPFFLASNPLDHKDTSKKSPA